MNNTSTFWQQDQNVSYFAKKPADPRIVAKLTPVQNKSNLQALDLGCGGGRHTQLLFDLGFAVSACDVNNSMLTYTRSRMQGKLPADKIVLGSITSLPYPNAFFDVIVTTGVLHQATSLADYQLALSELSRVAKDNCLVLLNIFTNKVLDDSYTFLDDTKLSIQTKEGLSMTLLPKDMFISLMTANGFQLLDDYGEDIKAENTGPRAVFRANFIKQGQPQP